MTNDDPKPKPKRDPNAVINPDFRICECLVGLSAYYNREWCHPSQVKICVLLKRFYGRSMSVRTLNRHLKTLSKGMWIKRTRQDYYDKKKGHVLRATRYEVAARWGSRWRRAIVAALKWSKLPVNSIELFQLPRLTDYRRLLV